MTEDYVAGTDINLLTVGGTRTSGAVQVSGNVIVSGNVTVISGHVSLASGAHVTADIAESGMGVTIASGLQVITQQGIQVSGDIVVTSGLVQQTSGAFVTTQPDIGVSGTVSVASGAFVTTQPTIYVSGNITVISGQVDVLNAPTQVSGAVIVSGAVAVSGSVTVISGLVDAVTSVSGNITPREYGDTIAYGRVQIGGGATVITSGHPDRLSIMINNESASEMRLGHDTNVASGVGFRLPADATVTVDNTRTVIYGAAYASGDYVSLYDELK